MVDGVVTHLEPFELDVAPSPLADRLIESHSVPPRILRGTVRRTFLATRQAGRRGAGEGPGRGNEAFLELPFLEPTPPCCSR